MGFMTEVISGFINGGRYDAAQARSKFVEQASTRCAQRHESVDPVRLTTDVYGPYANSDSEKAVWRDSRDQVDIDFTKYR